jgi:poly(3-hydroxybutyrate) depolymerase
VPKLLSRFPVWTSILCAVSLAIISPKLLADATQTGFQERVYRDVNGPHKYVVFVPTAYRPDKKWPVILFLHGAGSRGTDNQLPLVGGLAPQVRARAATFPFLVVFPQCEDVNSRLMFGWQAETSDGKRALRILDAVETDFSVDRSREILTGASMGAFGAWSLAAAAASRWSAVVIISGSADPATAPRLKDVPIWVFHGQNDLAVPITDERRIVTAVREAGGRAYLTELPGVRHNIGHVVYADDVIYQWMLEPRSDPRPESFLRNAHRLPTDAEMGRDFVQPFIPAVEIRQAIFVHLGKDAIESLMCALSDMFPQDKLSGPAPDVHRSQRSLMSRIDIALSNIRYRGTLEQMDLTTDNAGWATLRLGLRNMTLEIGDTQVVGRTFAAAVGPMDAVIGYQAPVWLSVKVRPYVDQHHVRLELGQTDFSIPDGNWYVTTPQVTTRGLPLVRDQINRAISAKLVSGVYAQKAQIESQIAATVPALIGRLEEQIDQKLSATRSLGSWPMPAFQPRFRLSLQSLRVDDSGVSLLCDMTFARPGLDTRERPVRRLERPLAKIEELPRGTGLEIGLSSAVVEGLAAAVTETGAALSDVRDLPLKEFGPLGDRANLTDAIPDLARYDRRLQIRTLVQAVEPIQFVTVGASRKAASAPGGALADGGRRHQLELKLPRLDVRVEIRPSPEATAWTPCAEFHLSLSQALQWRVQVSDFQTRRLNLKHQGDAEITVASKFSAGYVPVDPTLRGERVTDLFRDGWRAAGHLALFEQNKIEDKLIGTARLRVTEVTWSDPFIIKRYAPAATRITNGGREPAIYSVRGPRTAWGGPYTLDAGQSHDFVVPYPVTVQQTTPAGTETFPLPMGAQFILGAKSDLLSTPLAANPDQSR